MITDDRLKELMRQVGMPDSVSLFQALRQCDKEARLSERAACAAELADTQRALIEAAELRGYERGVDEARHDDSEIEQSYKRFIERNHALRDRVERLRGVCKTAAGMLLDAGDPHGHFEILGLVGDALAQEPPK